MRFKQKMRMLTVVSIAFPIRRAPLFSGESGALLQLPTSIFSFGLLSLNNLSELHAITLLLSANPAL